MASVKHSQVVLGNKIDVEENKRMVSHSNSWDDDLD
jgi:hypothetical protein